MKKLFLLLLFSIFVFGKTSVFKLSEFYPPSDILRGSQGETKISIPLPNRVKVKKAVLHIEYIPSKALVKQRSAFVLFFNGVVLYQQQIDTNIDLYAYNIQIPVSLIKDINKVKVMATQHYCMNCCENPSSSELWTEVLWDKSYLKIDYDFKNIEDNLLSYRDYVLDYKNFSPVSIGIITQTKNANFLTIGARISGYLGSIIKYRKLYVYDTDTLKKDMDIFLIGTKDYVNSFLNLKKNVKRPNIFVVRNPYYPTRVVVVITA
ncbi:cellulose biosynthesis cyclic di-GMP-binding regulatory protein BcsB, partial [Nautilia sp.]